MTTLSMLLFLLPHLTQATAIASAIDRAARPDERALVVALIFTESRGNPHACANDRAGGASRGLLQIRTAHSRCGQSRRHPLYGIRRNIEKGIRILRMLRRFEHDVHHDAHDPLDHYAGYRTRSRYSVRVRALAAALEQEGNPTPWPTSDETSNSASPRSSRP